MPPAHRYVLTITNVKTKAAIIALLPRTGAFSIPRIPDGTYTIEAFRDDRGTRMYFPGKAFPYADAEPYFLYPQTVHIRAQVDVEGVRIGF